jgi:zinc transport system substrate-binding protein
MQRFLIVSGFLILLAIPIAPIQAWAADSLQAAVTIAPQKYFVEKIGGTLVTVSTMVPPGANIHNYEPRPQQMVALSKAKIYFAIGVALEGAWLEKIISANPDLLLVHTEEGIEKISMAAHHHHEEDQQGATGPVPDLEKSGSQNEKHDETLDPHIWLAPHLVMIQARTILRALCLADPSHQDDYRKNYQKFMMELVNLDLEIMNIFKGKGAGIRFMVFHPAWGYFAKAYGLEQIPIEIEGKEPKPADLQRLIEQAKKLQVKVIFVQPQFAAKAAGTIAAALDAQVMNADDLALDWADNLRRVGQEFKSALR